MSAAAEGKSGAEAVAMRQAEPGDVRQLLAIEHAAFATDRLSARSLRALVGAESAALVVAAAGPRIAGYAAVLFRRRSRVARLYSIAVAADFAGRKLGRHLLGAAEAQALRRGCERLRLEVRLDNPAAAALYRKAGYLGIGERADYYEDGAPALRFEKALARAPRDSEPRKAQGLAAASADADAADRPAHPSRAG